MTILKPTFWLSTILLFTIMVSIILTMTVGIDKHHQTNDAFERSKIDSFMMNASYKEFDEKGLIKNIFATPYVEHSKDDNALFTRPDIVLYSTDRSIWQIHAEHGYYNKYENRLDLWGHVEVNHPADGNNPATYIATEAATYYLKQDKIVTKNHVTITRPDAQIQGVGAIANLKNNSITLLSNSQGNYFVSTQTNQTTQKK